MQAVMCMHGFVFMLGVPYQHRGHVRVDIIHQKLSIKGKAYIDTFGTLVFLFPVSIFLFLSSLDYVAFSWSVYETSAMPGGLPGVFIIKTLIPVMAILLFLQGIADLLRNVIILVDRTSTAESI